MKLVVHYCAILLSWILLPVATEGASRGSTCFTPNNEEATCIPFNSCPPIKNAVSTRNSSAINFAKDSQCGYDSEPLVCCGSIGYPIPTLIFDTSSDTTSNNNKVSAYQHRLFPNRSSCGIQEDDNRIYGGRNTGLYEFPWMALIRYDGENRDDVGFKCGGSLINSRYVLTAAHCVVFSSNVGITPFSVRLGEWKISTTPDCIGENQFKVCADPIVDVPIQESIPHANYRRRAHENDIALIRMARSVEFSDFIRPICIPSTDSPPPPQPGAYMTIAGWGSTEESTNSDVKLKATVPVVDRNTCSNRLAESGPVTEYHLCAGRSDGKDSCQGDSGGPLMRIVEDTQHAQFQWFLEGVISWGVGCGVKGFPGVYTRVSKYSDWIFNNIKG